jgi:hypothetical protein
MSKLEIARAAHDPLPDWMEALARECDRTSQNKTARLLGYTPGALSAVLGGSYKAGTDTIEQTVRGALMGETLECPVLGEIGKKVCRDWRGRAAKFSSRNTRSVMMFRACHRCPRHMQGDA